MARSGVAVARQVAPSLSPSALPLIEQINRGDKPLRDEILSLVEAKKRYGSKKPVAQAV